MSADVPAAGAAPLTITRDGQLYAQWWAQEANQPAIIEALELVAESVEVEHALHGLMLEVFQADVGPVEWLKATGLRAGVAIGYLNLDIDPAYDGEGVLDGVEAVVNLWTTAPVVSLTVAAYISRPYRVFAPLSVANHKDALAEVIDTALALINHEIADRDRFMFGARAPYPGSVASEGGQLPEVELSGYISDVDGTPVVQIDTTEAARRVRVCINDGTVYDGDPTCDSPPGAQLGANAGGCHECGCAYGGLVGSEHGQACSLHPGNVVARSR